MATAHPKNINKNTQLYYELMNSSLYHDPRFYREPVQDDTIGREEHEHVHVQEHEDASKPREHKEPRIIIYSSPTVTWSVACWGDEHEPVGEHVKKYRGKRSDLSDAYYSDCDDEVVVLSKIEAGVLGIFVWGATYYNNMQLGHLACALAKSINVTSSAIAALADEMGEIRKSVLQNHLATDYILLRMGHGCEEFDGLCCFDIKDKSQFIESKLKALHNITTHLTDSNALRHIWHVLTSWLPDFGWLKEMFLGIVIILIIGLISCIRVKSIPLCELCFRCCKAKKPEVKRKIFSQ
ncbi:hypothetical protein E2320_002417 [Naja naja]|nr:hypothetical protein E2320_002417 [Naja naja]